MWVAGLRGSGLNLGHTSRDWQDSNSGYFDFAMEDKGMKDIPAIVQKIQEVSDVEKVTYAGYSQGSTIMFYGLASDVEESFFADNVNAFIGIAPCVVLPFWLGRKESGYNRWINSDWETIEEFPLFNGTDF